LIVCFWAPKLNLGGMLVCTFCFYLSWHHTNTWTHS